MQLRPLFLIFILFAFTVSASPIDKRDASSNYMIQKLLIYNFFLLFSHSRKNVIIDKRDAEPQYGYGYKRDARSQYEERDAEPQLYKRDAEPQYNLWKRKI